ncbi:MAG: hypothetical protein IPJ65_39355 [Archangiaceae bacterium]|nr:hypothetical protein [Archangiaceae bacterium]
MQRVLADYRSAPIDDKLRAMLGFVEKLTLTPAEVTQADAAAVRAKGVSKQAMIDAIAVCAGFSVIVRIADATDFALSTPEGFKAGAKALLRFGYGL